jgi:REP element-mobilizing transposase RayT
MARVPRKYLPSGWFHCINRGAGRKTLFFEFDDYKWFRDNMIASLWRESARDVSRGALAQRDLGSKCLKSLDPSLCSGHVARMRKSLSLFSRQRLATARETGITIKAFCLMPNHWHIVCHCKQSTDMSQMFKKLSNAHTRRHHSRFQTIGHGPLYQGRFKSFLIKDENALDQICRYVEMNPVRAKLVENPEEWQWTGGQSSD